MKKKYLSLSAKLFLFIMIPFILVMIIISILSIQHRIKNERELTSNRIESYVILLESGDLSFNSINQKDKVEKLLNEKVLSAELIKRDRSIAFTTGGPEYEINKEQLDKAFQGYVITFTRQNKISVLISLYPIIVKNTVVGILHLELSFEQSNDRIKQYILFVLFLNIFGIILSFILVYFLFNKTILNRFKDLTDMCSEIRKGNLNYRLSMKAHDELGILAQTFNDTIEELVERNQQVKEEKQKVLDNIRELEKQVVMRQQSEKELKKHRDHLEELVKERTNKLEKSQQSLTLLLNDVNESREELYNSNKELEEK
ncbi:MAG: HAMP domain-containing protein, partial [Candidatus Cloacimonetes bacterium]|nr:HAMP domain-containing protein [Candidatus Cloacimonadota bacterium]